MFKKFIHIILLEIACLNLVYSPIFITNNLYAEEKELTEEELEEACGTEESKIEEESEKNEIASMSIEGTVIGIGLLIKLFKKLSTRFHGVLGKIKPNKSWKYLGTARLVFFYYMFSSQILLY